MSIVSPTSPPATTSPSIIVNPSTQVTKESRPISEATAGKKSGIIIVVLVIVIGLAVLILYLLLKPETFQPAPAADAGSCGCEGSSNGEIPCPPAEA